MITENIENINTNNVIVNNFINNSIIPNSKYYKIIYSNQYFTTYSLYINLNFQSIQLDLLNNNIYIDDNNINKNIINKIIQIEYSILNHNNKNKDKTINYKLKELLYNRFIKYITKYNNINKTHNIDNTNTYIKYNNNIVLKISGIWETNTSYGIIFKFIFF